MRRTLPWFLMTALFLIPTGALAEIEEGDNEFELYLGYYQPGSDLIDGDLTAGLRYGYNISQSLNIGGEFAFFGSDDNVIGETASATPVTADIQMYVLDVSVAGQFAVDSRTVPYLLGGIGFGKMDVKTRTSSVDTMRTLGAEQENSLTAHVGGGLKIDMTRNSYLRLDLRARWWEARLDDEVDGEFTVAIGWK